MQNFMEFRKCSIQCMLSMFNMDFVVQVQVALEKEYLSPETLGCNMLAPRTQALSAGNPSWAEMYPQRKGWVLLGRTSNMTKVSIQIYKPARLRKRKSRTIIARAETERL